MTETTSRVVLITGGSKGIGLACARHCAALGDRVAVTYNSSPPASEFFAVKCDVTDTDQVKLHFEIRRLGKPIDPATLLPPA